MGNHRIYAAEPVVEPTPHNVAVRDLYVKIVRSGYRMETSTFAPQFPNLRPDLAVTFADDGGNASANHLSRESAAVTHLRIARPYRVRIVHSSKGFASTVQLLIIRGAKDGEGI